MALELALVSIAALGGSGAVAYMGANIAQNVAKYFLYYDEFETEQNIKISDLSLGDHIFVPGAVGQSLKVKGLVGYYHHGVYLGVIDGKHMVTDYVGSKRKSSESGENFVSQPPKIRGLNEFLGANTILHRRKYKVPSKVLEPQKTLAFAESICSGKYPWPEYNLITNNCEHYATLLKMGQVHSEQAKHAPQEFFYRQFVVPNQGKSILRQHSVEN